MYVDLLLIEGELYNFMWSTFWLHFFTIFSHFFFFFSFQRSCDAKILKNANIQCIQSQLSRFISYHTHMSNTIVFLSDTFTIFIKHIRQHTFKMHFQENFIFFFTSQTNLTLRMFKYIVKQDKNTDNCL